MKIFETDREQLWLGRGVVLGICLAVIIFVAGTTGGFINWDG